MWFLELDTSIFDRYIDILDIHDLEPNYANLTTIIQSHLLKVPFENVSKLYYLKKFDLKFIPSFTQFLDGIEKYHFGGTCYTTNYYLHQLLKFLGYTVDLCGADMKRPDVHVANVVTIDEIEYIVDVGFSAPFLEPIPRVINDYHKIKTAENRYFTVKIENLDKKATLYHFTKNEYKFDYLLKLYPRKISDFKEAINNSFNPEAHFMNNLTISRFSLNYYQKLANFSYEEFSEKSKKNHVLTDNSHLYDFIERQFQIPALISKIALSSIKF